MIRAFLTSIVAVVAIVLPGFAEEKYAPDGGKFSIAFPAKPTTNTKQVDSPIGKITMNVHALEVRKDLGYLVVVNDYPDVVAKDKPQDVLGRVRDGSKGPDGKVVEDKPITFGTNGIPGREYLLEKGSEHFHRARTYIKGGRLYQIIVTGTKKEDVMSNDADKFLDSFEITK